jgi:hypothetical protein
VLFESKKNTNIPDEENTFIYYEDPNLKLNKLEVNTQKNQQIQNVATELINDLSQEKEEFFDTEEELFFDAREELSDSEKITSISNENHTFIQNKTPNLKLNKLEANTQKVQQIQTIETEYINHLFEDPKIYDNLLQDKENYRELLSNPSFDENTLKPNNNICKYLVDKLINKISIIYCPKSAINDLEKLKFPEKTKEEKNHSHHNKNPILE